MRTESRRNNSFLGNVTLGAVLALVEAIPLFVVLATGIGDIPNWLTLGGEVVIVLLILRFERARRSEEQEETHRRFADGVEMLTPLLGEMSKLMETISKAAQDASSAAEDAAGTAQKALEAATKAAQAAEDAEDGRLGLLCRPLGLKEHLRAQSHPQEWKGHSSTGRQAYTASTSVSQSGGWTGGNANLLAVWSDGESLASWRSWESVYRGNPRTDSGPRRQAG